MPAPASNQGHANCNLTLAPANPIAPRKAKGRQQARVDSAAITAATELTRSATRMRIFTLSASRVQSRSAAILLMGCRCGLHTADKQGWEQPPRAVRHPLRRYGWSVSRGTAGLELEHRCLSARYESQLARTATLRLPEVSGRRVRNSGSRVRTEPRSSSLHLVASSSTGQGQARCRRR
jgi:hypothetical protein